MNKTGKSSNNSQTTRLLAELQQLRKGRGLTAWKLRDTFELKRIIAKRVGLSPGDLSTHQIYSYLLYEINQLGREDVAVALRSAYAIGQENNPRTLTDRRLDLAVQLGRHSDTIKAYENEALQSLQHRLVSPLDYAALAPKLSSVVKVPTFTRGMRATEESLQNIAVESLAGLYDLGSHRSEILRGFGRNAQPYMNVDFECSFRPSERGADWYSYKFSYRFQSAKDVFRIGIAFSNKETSLLMASGLVDEVVQLNTIPDYDREIPEILKRWRFAVQKASADPVKMLSFSEISEGERSALLDSIWRLKAENCRIIEVRVPDEYQVPSAIYELRASIDLPVAEHYAYWEAPGLMYLNTIKIDLSQFPNRKKWRFFIKPFLGTVFPPSVEADGDKFLLPASSWVMFGHGIAVIWQEA